MYYKNIYYFTTITIINNYKIHLDQANLPSTKLTCKQAVLFFITTTVFNNNYYYSISKKGRTKHAQHTYHGHGFQAVRHVL